MVEAVLAVEPVNHTALDGLNHNHRTVEVGLLVHVPYNPVNESTEEVTLTKLNDFLWHHALRSRALVQSLQFLHDLFIVLNRLLFSSAKV